MNTVGKPSDAFHIYDTTLRDGAQQEGLNLSVHDKLTIARHLDDFCFFVVYSFFHREVLFLLENLFLLIF